MSDIVHFDGRLPTSTCVTLPSISAGGSAEARRKSAPPGTSPRRAYETYRSQIDSISQMSSVARAPAPSAERAIPRLSSRSG